MLTGASHLTWSLFQWWTANYFWTLYLPLSQQFVKLVRFGVHVFWLKTAVRNIIAGVLLQSSQPPNRFGHAVGPGRVWSFVAHHLTAPPTRLTQRGPGAPHAYCPHCENKDILLKAKQDTCFIAVIFKLPPHPHPHARRARAVSHACAHRLVRT